MVPWSAVVHDIHGGTWVYERTAPRVYTRRRVEVKHVQGSGAEAQAVLARGPAPGAMVVSVGAAELFGTEFGTRKMMAWLIERALRLRLLILCLTVLLLAGGWQLVRSTPLDVFPEFAAPIVEIQTEAPGLSTSEVESLITVPLESALGGTSWLQTLRSKSVLGLSSVLLLFEPGTDLLRARQLVGERLAVRSAAARGGPTAGDVVAAVLDEPGPEDRHLVEDAGPDGDDHPGALDDPAAPDGHPRGGQRGHLGPARPAGAGAGRSRPAGGPQGDARRGRDRRPRRHRAGGGRIRRHAQPAPVGDATWRRSSKAEDLARVPVAFRPGLAPAPGRRRRRGGGPSPRPSATPSSTTAPACC